MFKRSRVLDRINAQLATLGNYVRLSGGQERRNVNVDAEMVFCQVLSILLNADFCNLNTLKKHHPAIDLGDPGRGICVQVTSTITKAKVQSTLDKLFDHELDLEYSRLIVLMIGDRPASRWSFTLKKPFDFDPDRDIWDLAKLGEQIGDLPDDRLETLAAYIDSQFGSSEKPAPLFRLPASSNLGDGFVGRDGELEQLHRAVKGNTKPVILSGIGGMGKTELAIRFAGEYGDGNVYFALFQDTFRKTVVTSIAQGIPGLLDRRLPEEQVFGIVMEQLMQCPTDDLLILDNVDDAGESFSRVLSQVRALPLRVLLTTRTDASRSIDVARLPNGELYQIFENHKVHIPREQMDALIEAVDGHTLTIDLMARSMHGGWRKVTAETYLTAFREQAAEKLPAREISSDYSDLQDRVYEHLKVVFNVVGIPDEERAVLTCAALLPQSGMDPELFGNALPKAQQDALQRLLDHGWLSLKEELLTIHPVIRMVAREELKPTDENCGAFLIDLWNQWNLKKYDAEQYRQRAELFSAASDLLEDRVGDWALVAGRFWYELGDAQTALKYNLQMVAQRKKIRSSDHPDLATAYNNVGLIYGELGDHFRALEFKQKALAICEKVLPGNHPDLATAYNNVGSTYGDLGNHRKALEYLLKALAIREKVLPGNHPDLAASYNNVGFTYGNLGNLRKALENLLKALAIQEKVLPEDHPDLAVSYNNVGITYGDLGNYHKALEFQLKALVIREKVLPRDHPNLAASYNNVGSTYSDLGDLHKALKYLLKALAIWKKVLPGNHPDIAMSCFNIGMNYFKLGEYVQSRDYLRRAVEIAEQSLPEGHPLLALYRENLEAIETFFN